MKKIAMSILVMGMLMVTSFGNKLMADTVSSVDGQKKVKIAVMDFKTVGEDNAQLGAAVSENIRTALIDSNQFNVIERSALEKIIEEQKLQNSGITDSSQAVELGKIAGAEKIVIGSITKMGKVYTINVRFIDVATGTATIAKKGETKSQDEFPSIIDDIVQTIIKQEQGANIKTVSNTGTTTNKIQNETGRKTQYVSGSSNNSKTVTSYSPSTSNAASIKYLNTIDRSGLVLKLGGNLSGTMKIKVTNVYGSESQDFDTESGGCLALDYTKNMFGGLGIGFGAAIDTAVDCIDKDGTKYASGIDFVPIYGILKYDFNYSGKVNPYLIFKVGYGMALYGDKIMGNDKKIYSNTAGGGYAALGAGIEISRVVVEIASVANAASFEQETSYFYYSSPETTKYELNFSKTTFLIGYTF